MKDRMDTETFGEALRRLRGDLSLREVARRANCGKSYVADLEHGRRKPSPAVAVALDSAVAAGGELAALSDRSGDDLRSGYPDLAAVTAAALSVGSERPRHVDPALLDYFHDQLEGHYRADMMLGPHDLIGTVSAQYQLIDRLLRAASGEVRAGLMRVGAAYAALVGWLYQDAGDLPAAAFWRGVTQEIAERSRDQQMIAYALVNHASVRTDLGDGSGVIDLCAAALADERRLAPKTRLMALQQQAHGASLVGDQETADVLLDQAGTLVDRIDDDLPWGNACRRTPGYIEVQRATCYGRLGLGGRAAALWAQLLSTAPGGAGRDRGVYLARQATAYAVSSDPDQALDVAKQAVDLAVATGSARLRHELESLTRSMKPWRSTTVGRDMADLLVPVTQEVGRG